MSFGITTFFSYKGGAGRSTTCLNTIPFLADEYDASERSPLLLLDTDIESAGMTYLLDASDAFQGKFDVKSLLLGDEQWSISKAEGGIQNHELYAKFLPVGHKFGLSDDRAVMFLGVDDTKNINKATVDGKKAIVMQNFKLFCKNNGVCGAVLDSAAGDQTTAAFSVERADNLVLCMKPTRQFRHGTFNYLRRMNIRLGGSAPYVILLPTVVPKNCVIDGVEQLENAVEDVERFLPTVSDIDIGTEFTTVECFGINEVTRFKWREAILSKIKADRENELTEDELVALDRYAKLANKIVWG